MYFTKIIYWELGSSEIVDIKEVSCGWIVYQVKTFPLLII